MSSSGWGAAGPGVGHHLGCCQCPLCPLSNGLYVCRPCTWCVSSSWWCQVWLWCMDSCGDFVVPVPNPTESCSKRWGRREPLHVHRPDHAEGTLISTPSPLPKTMKLSPNSLYQKASGCIRWGGWRPSWCSRALPSSPERGPASEAWEWVSPLWI